MYVPQPPPVENSVEELKRWAGDEFDSVADSQTASISSLHFDVLHAAPSRVFNGLVVVADGTDWNPGSGAGMYLYLGAAWNKL